jgi:siroheme synthase
VFGRGGEELEFLASRHIPWEVIPGVSAGVGGLSALGLPLTHRHVGSSVTLLTGSQANTGNFGGIGGAPGLSGEQTLVFYMGFQHVAAIAEDLMRQGLDRDTYALCASRLTAPDQRVLAAPLGAIGAEVAATALQTPALLVVGNVVAFWKTNVGSAPGGEQP